MTIQTIHRIAREIEQAEAKALANAPKQPRQMLRPIDQKILQVIQRYKIAHDGNSPTIREIGKAVGVNSTSMIDFYLDRLVEAGRIKRLPGKRGIVVVGGKWTPPEEK